MRRTAHGCMLSRWLAMGKHQPSRSMLRGHAGCTPKGHTNHPCMLAHSCSNSGPSWLWPTKTRLQCSHWKRAATARHMARQPLAPANSWAAQPPGRSTPSQACCGCLSQASPLHLPSRLPRQLALVSLAALASAPVAAAATEAAAQQALQLQQRKQAAQEVAQRATHGACWWAPQGATSSCMRSTAQC